MKSLSVIFLLFFLSSTASAHTGLAQYSVSHLFMHAGVSIFIYIAIMLAGLALFKHLPKAKAQRIRIPIKDKSNKDLR